MGVLEGGKASACCRGKYAQVRVDDGERAAVFGHLQTISPFRVHVDNIWSDQRHYLYDGGIPPVRKAQNKRHVIEVVFLASVSRPRYNPATNTVFDGKVDLWPFVEERAAEHTSRNRTPTTLERKCAKVMKATYKSRNC